MQRKKKKIKKIKRTKKSKKSARLSEDHTLKKTITNYYNYIVNIKIYINSEIVL